MVTRINSTEWNEIRSKIYLRDAGICWVCHLFVTLDLYNLSHLIDRCMDGDDDYSNLVVMHTRCNKGKPTHHTMEECTRWKEERAKYILKTKRYHNPIFHRRTYQAPPKPKNPIKQNKIKPLTITWIQGKSRWLFPPSKNGTYSKSNSICTEKQIMIEGSKIFINNYNTPQSTIEVLNDINNSFTSATIELGLFFISIYRDKDGLLKISYTPNKAKANCIGINRYTSKKIAV